MGRLHQVPVCLLLVCIKSSYNDTKKLRFKLNKIQALISVKVRQAWAVVNVCFVVCFFLIIPLKLHKCSLYCFCFERLYSVMAQITLSAIYTREVYLGLVLLC